jgi:hypothetical protein
LDQAVEEVRNHPCVWGAECVVLGVLCAEGCVLSGGCRVKCMGSVVLCVVCVVWCVG